MPVKNVEPATQSEANIIFANAKKQDTAEKNVKSWTGYLIKRLVLSISRINNDDF